MPVLCTYSKMLLQEHFDVDSRLNLRPGELVVLRTRRGVEVGKVAAEPGTTRMRRDENTAGKVVRRVNGDDKAWFQAQRTEIKVSKELREARRLGREMAIDCLFAEVEHMLEEDRSVVYYVSEGRVDLGDLPKRLADAVGHRVDFRQVGARDVARLSGDVGSCGEELCCKTFLVDFAPVTMKMAKNQGLGVDMAKVSGMCGRLKCCLRYEDELYTKLRETMPKNGQPATVNGEEGWIVSANLLTQTCLVEINGKREEFPVADVTYDPKMSEGQIRRWQREMRDAKAAEYEARNQEREARKAFKDQQTKDRMSRNSRPGREDAHDGEGEPNGESFDGEGDPELNNRNDSAPPQGERRQDQQSRRPLPDERRARQGAPAHAGPRHGDGQRRGDGPRDGRNGPRPPRHNEGPRNQRPRPEGEQGQRGDGRASMSAGDRPIDESGQPLESSPDRGDGEFDHGGQDNGSNGGRDGEQRARGNRGRRGGRGRSRGGNPRPNQGQDGGGGSDNGGGGGGVSNGPGPGEGA